MSTARKSRENTTGINQAEVSTRRILSLIVAAGLVAVTVAAVHRPALSAGALSFDDHQYLTQNSLVQNPGLDSARRFLCEVLEPSTVRGYYQPLTMISLMLDYARGGRENNLRPFHATSLSLHVFNTMLVIVFLYLLFGRVWIAAAAGLLFGLHPMTVETIAWVSERKTVLATFFSLLSLNFYVAYTHKGGRKPYFGCLLTYVLALMSKPTSISLPVLMLVLDYWPIRRIGKRAILEKVPLFIMGAVSAIITVISQGRTATITMPGQYPITAIPLIICHNIIFYLCKIFRPVNLSSHYPFPQPFGILHPRILVGVTGSFVLAAALIVSLRWTRAVLAGTLFFLIAVFPTMQIIGFSNVVAADKFVYLPSIGLLLIIAYFLTCLWDSAAMKHHRWLYRVVIAAAVVIGAAAESIGTRRYLTRWHDTESLYLYMIHLAPNAATLHNNFGVAYYQQGRIDKAIKYWTRAFKLNPNYIDPMNNLAWVMSTHQDPKIRNGPRAIQLAQRACELTDYKRAEYLDTLATAYAEAGEFDRAARTAKNAIELATEAKQTGLANEINGRLELYKKRKAYREPKQP